MLYSRRFLGCALVLAGASLFAQGNAYYLPQVFDGPFQHGKLTTTIVITNAGSAMANVSLAFSKDDGTPLEIHFAGVAQNSMFSISLKPGATRVLKTSGTGTGVPGAGVVTSDMPVTVSAMLSSSDASGKLLSSSGLGSSDVDTGYTFAVDTTGGFDTGVAFYNPGANAATLSYTLFDTHGSQVGTASGDLAAAGHVSKSVGSLFPNAHPFKGTIAVASSVSIAAWVTRENPASPVYTLLSASPSASQRLKFYFPEVADGDSSTGKVTTTFQFVNLSANTASIKLSLSRNGLPWQVTFAGEGTKSAFPFTLPPGGESYWQTVAPSSLSASTRGSAMVIADNPISVTAIVATVDRRGNLIAETGLTEARPRTSFMIPFDLTDAATGVTFYNPRSQSATLKMTLLDETGKSVAEDQTNLAPGGTLSGAISNFFPHAKLTSGAIAISTGGPASPAVSAVAIRRPAAGLAISTLPVSPTPLTGNPVTIAPAMDASHQVSANISTAGGTLNLTDAAGNQFSLTIPANAVLSPVMITMTPVTAIRGLPQGTFAACVQLGPDGLELFAPATLTVNLASPVNSPVPLGWHGTGSGIYLNPLQPGSKTLTMQLMHFSGAGVVESGSVSAILLNIVNIWDLETSTISSLVSKGDLDGVSDKIADLYADALVPLMQLALETKDNDLLLCAISHASEFSRQWLLMGEDHNSSGMTVDGVEIDPGADTPFITSAKAVISNFINLATTLYTNNTLKSCDQSGDPFVGLNLLTLARQLVLFGGDESGANELVNAALNSCPPKLELDFSSTMTGTYQYAVGDVTDSFNFSGEISSHLPLQLNITQNSIRSLQDLNADFTIPVGVSGSAPETYSNVTLSGAVTAPNFSCSASLAGATPSTLTVKPGTGTQTSQIEFQVTSKYDPRLVALGGTALCSFCPIYEKTPFRVELLVDPGSPSESYTACGVPGSTTQWLAFWQAEHFSASGDQEYFTDWLLPGPNGEFAEKDLAVPVPIPPSPVSIQGTENTTLKLVVPAAAPTQ